MLGRLTALASMAICILLMSEGAGAAGPELPTLQPGVLRIGTYFVNPPFDLIVNTVRTPKIRSLSDLRDAVVVCKRSPPTTTWRCACRKQVRSGA